MIIPQPIVGVAFINNNKLLIVKSVKSAKDNLFTLVGGGVMADESLLAGAIRECHEEVDYNLDIKEEDLTFITSYIEPAASDSSLLIKMHIYLARNKIVTIPNCNPEIIEYKWYQVGDDLNISSSIKKYFLPYAIKNKILK
ncbi:MAG: NUDIX hydrolase [Bacilli bacterium]